MRSVVIISNYTSKEYFFSTDHCQPHELGDNWASVTHYLPSRVVPREGLEDGIINHVKDLIKVFYNDYHKVLNPDIEYQIDYHTDV